MWWHWCQINFVSVDAWCPTKENLFFKIECSFSQNIFAKGVRRLSPENVSETALKISSSELPPHIHPPECFATPTLRTPSLSEQAKILLKNWRFCEMALLQCQCGHKDRFYHRGGYGFGPYLSQWHVRERERENYHSLTQRIYGVWMNA